MLDGTGKLLETMKKDPKWGQLAIIQFEEGGMEYVVIHKLGDGASIQYFVCPVFTVKLHLNDAGLAVFNGLYPDRKV